MAAALPNRITRREPPMKVSICRSFKYNRRGRRGLPGGSGGNVFVPALSFLLLITADSHVCGQTQVFRADLGDAKLLRTARHAGRRRVTAATATEPFRRWSARAARHGWPSTSSTE